jgi:hypothetical protein
MSDKLKVGRGNSMEINVEKTRAMRTSRQPTSLHIRIDKPVENVEEFKIWAA